MDIQKLTIGQMADLNHMTRETLRHYEVKGLLIPYYTEPGTGYRYYHINQSAVLDMIQYLKFCGMSLDQIKRQFEIANKEDVHNFLMMQLNSIDESLKRLHQSRRVILNAIDNYTRYKSLPSHTILHEYLPPRKMYVYKSQINFFEEYESGYEMMLRELKTSLIDKNLSSNYFSNLGTIIRKSKLEERKLYSDEVFAFVDESDSLPDALEVIPGGTYVSLCSEDIFKEEEYAGQLLDYIKEHDYVIAGDYLCEVVAEYPMFDHFHRNILYKIQIPINPKADDA